MLVRGSFAGQSAFCKCTIYIELVSVKCDVENICASDATLVFSVQVNAIAQGRTEWLCPGRCSSGNYDASELDSFKR